MTPRETGALPVASPSPSAALAPFASRAQLSALVELTKPSITTLVMVTMVSGALAASVPIRAAHLALPLDSSAYALVELAHLKPSTTDANSIVGAY